MTILSNGHLWKYSEFLLNKNYSFKKEKRLSILGLMVIPPNDNNHNKYFEHLNFLNKSLGLNEMSMGMSSDYEDAIKHNSTFIRVGSSIFGERS